MIKVAVFGIVASLIAMKIKTIRPEIAVVIAVISSILLAMCWTVFFLLYWRGTYIWSERWNHYRFRKFYRNPNVMFDRTK